MAAKKERTTEVMPEPVAEGVTKTVEVNKETQTLAYIGPNIVQLSLVTYQVYIQGVPPIINTLSEERQKVLRQLFVPLSELSQSMHDVKTQGKAAYAFYMQAMEIRGQLQKEGK